ncbi:hypothetical protein ACKC9G_06800 [Pokkaliibacter sp. CJK22405]|uniref:hypothetical protein n=1 Tax=Pokkaliibacter sp. CJK22405 TaxID=3384615 RepID=UPI0039854DD7
MAMNYVSHTPAQRQFVTIFRGTKVQKLHLDGYRELATYVKFRDYHYTIYVEIDPVCQAKVTKRTNARP